MIRIPYFDDAEIELIEPGVLDDAEADAALKRFLALTPANRLADSRHVHAYYRDYHQAVGGEDWFDPQMGVPATAAEIWKHVSPNCLFLSKDRRSGCWHVVVEANCAWEEELGLMLVWRDGTTLTKAGGYDGHVTNVNAHADETMNDVVYSASDPQFTTRLGDPA